MLIPRAAPNRVRLFFVACGESKADNESSEKQGLARTRMCRDACGAVGTWETCGVRGACGVRGVCESCAGVPLCCAKNGCDNAISWCKKRLPMQKLRTPLATDYKQTTAARCYQHLLPAPTNSGQARHVALPAKSRHSNATYPAGGLYPRPAPTPLSPIQLFPSHAAGRSVPRFCCHFLFPFPLTVHRRVGMSASCPSECPSALTFYCQHRRLNARRTSPSSQHLPSLTNHRPDIPHTKKQIGTTLTDRPDAEQRIIFLLT